MDLFSYPLDTNYILRKRKTLKNKLLQSEVLITKNIAILGGSTTSEVKNILEVFLLSAGIKPNFYESEYGLYQEDALFGNEKLNSFTPDLIYIHTTIKNISGFPELSDSKENVDNLVQAQMDKFEAIWEAIKRFNCPVIQNNFDFPADRSLGNLDSTVLQGRTSFINQLNSLFAEYARNNSNFFINDINYLSSWIGIQNWYDQSLWFQAKYALALTAIPELTFNISKIYTSILGRTKKCLVLDLDNTCWGGVIGDDGLGGIHIGNGDALSEAHSSFQAYALELKNRGIILAVCSKNDIENAHEGFKHPGSILKLEDFSSFKANWLPKHENIDKIAKEINIGIDSLVFIDDNPVEREIIKSHLSSVSVPNVGDRIQDFLVHLDRNGYFEATNLSSDDINRNKYYSDNVKRKRETSQFKNYGEFLNSLGMTAEIKPFSEIYLERITQLTNKTNQFNVTTNRYSSSAIKEFSESDMFITLYGRLVDKFGDNGLTAVSIGRIEGSSCYIDLWLMSCRVLKREMEFAMLDEFIRQCKLNNVDIVIGNYIATAKNKMVSMLFKEFGFKQTGGNGDDSTWILEVKDYQNQNKYIGVNND